MASIGSRPQWVKYLLIHVINGTNNRFIASVTESGAVDIRLDLRINRYHKARNLYEPIPRSAKDNLYVTQCNELDFQWLWKFTFQNISQDNTLPVLWWSLNFPRNLEK